MDDVSSTGQHSSITVIAWCNMACTICCNSVLCDMAWSTPAAAISSAAVASGGAWQGKKVTFGEDGDQEGGPEAAAGADQEQEAQQQAAPAEEPKAQTSSKRSKRSKADSGVGSDGAEPKGANASKKKVKWGSLAVQQLQQLPGGVLKWKKLWPLLLTAAAEQQRQGGKVKGAVDDSSKEKAWQKLQSCSKLQIDGKLVTLAA